MVLSVSAIVSAVSIATALEFSVNVALPPAVIVGASLTGRIVIEEFAVADAVEEASETIHERVRLAVGLSTDEENVTERNAICHAATLIPEPLTVSTPVAES